MDMPPVSTAPTMVAAGLDMRTDTGEAA